MSFSMIIYDTIRKTPSKFIIIFNVFIIVGVFSPRYKILKSYKEFKVKECEIRRREIFKKSIELI